MILAEAELARRASPSREGLMLAVTSGEEDESEAGPDQNIKLIYDYVYVDLKRYR